MRLLQQYPAWSIHAYLRFLGINYTTENVITIQALGYHVPVLVDINKSIVIGNNEEEILYYLATTYSCHQDVEMSTDKVFATYLKFSLQDKLKYIYKSTGIYIDMIKKVIPCGLNYYYIFLYQMQDYINDHKSNISDKVEVFQQLHAIYKELDDAFRHKMTEGCTPIFSLSYYPNNNNPSSNINDDQPESAVYEATSYSHVEAMGMLTGPNNHSTPGLAEAVLFGHISEMLSCSTETFDLIQKYSGVMSFYRYICRLYFSVPYHYPNYCINEEDWKASLESIISNPFLERNDNYNTLISLLVDSIPSPESLSPSSINMNKNKGLLFSPIRRYSQLMESDEKIEHHDHDTSLNNNHNHHHHHDDNTNDYNQSHVPFETPGVTYQYPALDSIIQDTNPISKNKVSTLDHHDTIPVTVLFPTFIDDLETDHNPPRINKQQQQVSGQQQLQLSGQQQQQQQLQSQRKDEVNNSNAHVTNSSSSIASSSSIDSKYDGSTITSIQEDNDQNRGRSSRKLQSSLSIVLDDDDDGDIDDVYDNIHGDNDSNNRKADDHESMTPQAHHMNHNHHHNHTSKHHNRRLTMDEVMIDQPSKWTKIELNYHPITIMKTFITSYFIKRRNESMIISPPIDDHDDDNDTSMINDSDKKQQVMINDDEDSINSTSRLLLLHEDTVSVSLGGVAMLSLVGVCFLSYFHTAYSRG